MGTIILPITLSTAAGLALINFWLSMRIGSVRRAEKISVGDGGNERLIRRMRAQANFIENGPFVLALIGLIELARGPGIVLWAVSAVFLIGRVLHAFGMDGMKSGRYIGTIITMLSLLGLALWAIYIAYLPGAPVQFTAV